MGVAFGRKIMKIEVKKFGEILTSRTEGREAYLVSRAYLRPAQIEELIELDFEGVKVLTPSWADEFISGLRSEYGKRLVCLPSANPTVIASLQMVREF
jgi:hypothetical protein